MTYIGLLSDTHGFLHPRVFDFFSPCNEIWHAGDIGPHIIGALEAFKPLKAVYGNIDDHKLRAYLPEYQSFTVEQKNVLMTHIAGNPTKYKPAVKQKIAQLKPGLVVAGHSHILRIQYDKANQLLFINPGAAGLYGIHQKITLVRFRISGTDIHDLEIFEAPKTAPI